MSTFSQQISSLRLHKGFRYFESHPYFPKPASCTSFIEFIGKVRDFTELFWDPKSFKTRKKRGLNDSMKQKKSLVVPIPDSQYTIHYHTLSVWEWFLDRNKTVSFSESSFDEVSTHPLLAKTLSSGGRGGRLACVVTAWWWKRPFHVLLKKRRWLAFTVMKKWFTGWDTSNPVNDIIDLLQNHWCRLSVMRRKNMNFKHIETSIPDVSNYLIGTYLKYLEIANTCSSFGSCQITLTMQKESSERSPSKSVEIIVLLLQGLGMPQNIIVYMCIRPTRICMPCTIGIRYNKNTCIQYTYVSTCT